MILPHVVACNIFLLIITYIAATQALWFWILISIMLEKSLIQWQ